MKLHGFFSLTLVFLSIISFGQNKIDLKANFDIENRKITVSQTIQYKNTSQDVLQSIYLNDWNNSYSTKKTPLAIRFAEEYDNKFHLAKNEDRGYSVITSIKQNNDTLVFNQLKNQPDVIKVELKTPLQPNEFYSIDLEYIVQIPKDKFTNYGISEYGELTLKYWYITPAVYNGEWQYYSNKNLDDLFIPKADLSLEITYPNGYIIISDLNLNKSPQNAKKQIINLVGKDRVSNKLLFRKRSGFETIETQNLSLISNIDNDGLELMDRVLITEKITKFILKNLGDYPHKKLLLTDIDYNKDPIYGLNFLPSFIKVYPITFKYELKLLKVAIRNYLENTLLINPRKDQWLIDGIQIYYLMNYVEEHYPNMKFLGSLADFWGVRSFHAADMTFNDKYVFAFMSMSRTNRDQPLTMSKDSLLKFNANLANKYKAGVGLKYLDDFINSNVLENTLKSFLEKTKLQLTSPKEFEDHLKSKTPKDVDWFFNDYINTRKKIDFKIKKITKTEDSITLTLKNKRNSNTPISLYALNNDSIVSKYWIENVRENKTITIPRNDANKLVLNYNRVIPEFNQRDNWKSLKGFFFNNKPLQFRLFKDIEDPNYNQVFLMPLAEFNNIYDGFTFGLKAYNTTLLRKQFNYKIQPRYALKSKSFTGSASASMTHYLENSNLYSINYGIKGGYSSYAEDLFVRKIIPSLTFLFRNDNDFRSNKRQRLKLRYIDINRDEDVNNIVNTTEPNYNIFNINYLNSNDNLINFSKWSTDLQIAKTFSKVSFNYEYRRLFESNRQLNLRFFTGAFLSNRTDATSDYFSFALDRPTDYLFDYNYLGRSEASGIFSQQYITAEGGFKSKLETPFANQWISTINTSTTLWKYILAYGDIGIVKNKFENLKFVYDSGIRIDLVTDYFEIYFPIYSNLGWEIGQPNYDQKIRFKFTLDPQSLLGLFRRRWY
ncbi:metalloprotease [Sabulilitoribacter arenilitoris]|uniref:Metalloprotease n=1 Tax=Wocania arenilitoris TaxID=2044858 RepID=A0AAE3EMB9_9FLAO|nr:metalloprotease [Wocania arenilitoris]MCF7568051.1 metalloprotease [Wocania arenilitoris]